MLKWLLSLFKSDPKTDPHARDSRIRSFEDDTSDMEQKDYTHSGVKSIRTSKIIGSVGRAHELDDQFRYRNRANTARYHYIEDAVRQGKPMEPIKVVKVKRDRGESEYYVMDGHHRVAHAKKKRLSQMNADITEVDIQPEDEYPEDETNNDAK